MLAATWIAMLLASTSARVIYALPALVPLAICAAAVFGPHTDALRAGARRGRTGWRTWGALALLVLPALAAVAIRLFGRPVSPDPALLPGHLALTLVCLALGGLAWVLGWRPRWPQALAGGLALGLSVALTVFLDSADQRAGFGTVLRDVARHVPADQCLASQAFGESERGMLEYFAGRQTVRVEVAPEAARECRWLLNQRRLREESLPDCPSGWTDRRFRRPGDDQEYQLCERPGAG